MTHRPYLDYYSRINDIPVHQDTSDFAAHVRRRSALYRSLHLPKLAFQSSRILEIGPGTGDNATATLTFGPAEYVLLDGNPSSVQALLSKIDVGQLDRDICTVLEGDFLGAPSQRLRGRTFDIVLAEGCIPYQRDPAAAVRHVLQYVKPGGVLVITTTDQISMLSEICRRYYKPAIMRLANDDFDAALELCAAIFTPQLACLPAASRPVEDWSLDNILHPWGTSWALSVSDAISASPDLQFLGASPNFVTDWRWYKSFADGSNDWSAPAISAWATVSPYTLDWREPYTGPLSPAIAHEIDGLASTAAEMIEEDWNADSFVHAQDILQTLNDLSEVLRTHDVMQGVQSGIRAFGEVVRGLLSDDPFVRIPEFDAWWGRGMQYVSLTRRET